jgi:hypothetical protein
MFSKRYSLLRVSLFGFILTLLLNLLLHGFTDIPSAVFFSIKWRYLWLPIYIVWLIFAAIGFVKVFKKQLAELVDELYGR